MSNGLGQKYWSKEANLRPYLGPRVGDHGETSGVIVEPNPCDLLEGVESSDELYHNTGSSVHQRRKKGKKKRTKVSNELEKVRVFFNSVLNRILTLSPTPTSRSEKQDRVR